MSLPALGHPHRSPRPAAPPISQLTNPRLLFRAPRLTKHASRSKSTLPPFPPSHSLSALTPSPFPKQPVCFGPWPPFSPLLLSVLMRAGVSIGDYSSTQAVCTAPGGLSDCSCRFTPETDRWDLHCAVPAARPARPVPVMAHAVLHCRHWCNCETPGQGPEMLNPAGVGWRAYRPARVE